MWIDNLKKCECGGSPLIKNAGDKDFQFFWICCSNCEEGTFGFPTLEYAIKSWNKRITVKI